MGAETPEKEPRSEKGPHELNARLRELLAIPERLRTDAQWDEIIEIEISQQQGRAPGTAKRSGPGPMRQTEGKSPHKNFRKGPMKSGRG